MLKPGANQNTAAMKVESAKIRSAKQEIAKIHQGGFEAGRSCCTHGRGSGEKGQDRIDRRSVGDGRIHSGGKQKPADSLARRSLCHYDSGTRHVRFATWWQAPLSAFVASLRAKANAGLQPHGILAHGHHGPCYFSLCRSNFIR